MVTGTVEETAEVGAVLVESAREIETKRRIEEEEMVVELALRFLGLETQLVRLRQKGQYRFQNASGQRLHGILKLLVSRLSRLCRVK